MLVQFSSPCWSTYTNILVSSILLNFIEHKKVTCSQEPLSYVSKKNLIHMEIFTKRKLFFLNFFRQKVLKICKKKYFRLMKLYVLVKLVSSLINNKMFQVKEI